jgi:hypothetical protein
MFVLPLVGAVGGFHIRVRPAPIEQESETELRKALAVAAGSFLGERAYLSALIFYPMMVEPEGGFCRYRLHDRLFGLDTKGKSRSPGAGQAVLEHREKSRWEGRLQSALFVLSLLKRRIGTA